MMKETKAEQQMKKFFKLLLMIFLGIAGLCFAGAAIYGSFCIDPTDVLEPFTRGRWRGCIYCGVLSVLCFIGIKKVFETWYD